MPILGFTAAPRSQEEPSTLVRRSMRLVQVALGFVIIAIGAAVFFVPFTFHIPGLLLLALGLVLVLRNSFHARRRFIRAQRRHPNVVFPLRRMLRRKPEIVPVIWHLLLKGERLILRHRWRFFRRMRRSVWRRRGPFSRA